MNKFHLLLVVFLALFLALPASAQVELGFIGGVNIANLNGKNIYFNGVKTDFSSRTALGVGGVLDIGLSKNFGLRFEPMYLQNGAEFISNLVDPDFGEVTFKVNYLEAPLFLKIALGASATRPYVLAGPIIGFKMSSKFTASAGGPDVEIDADEITKSTDFGLAFGAGVSFPTGSSSIFVEGRYALGLTDVAEASTLKFMGKDIPFDDANVKTRGIQIMGGITFPLGGK